MKNLGYFIYGFISAIALILLIFNVYADLILDDYYITKLYHDWYKIWNIITFTVNCIFVVCSFVWVYSQGVATATEEKLIDENNQYE